MTAMLAYLTLLTALFNAVFIMLVYFCLFNMPLTCIAIIHTNVFCFHATVFGLSIHCLFYLLFQSFGFLNFTFTTVFIYERPMCSLEK